MMKMKERNINENENEKEKGTQEIWKRGTKKNENRTNKKLNKNDFDEIACMLCDIIHTLSYIPSKKFRKKKKIK